MLKGIMLFTFDSLFILLHFSFLKAFDNPQILLLQRYKWETMDGKLKASVTSHYMNNLLFLHIYHIASIFVYHICLKFINLYSLHRADIELKKKI